MDNLDIPDKIGQYRQFGHSVQNKTIWTKSDNMDKIGNYRQDRTLRLRTKLDITDKNR